MQLVKLGKVGVTVGVRVGVLVAFTGVLLGVGDAVGVLVGVSVGVLVGVFVGVCVGVSVGVAVASVAVKHSFVVTELTPDEYCAPASGVYSARKQYVPAAEGIKPSEVATPPLKVLVPADAPPLTQGVALPVGPQTKNATVPVTVPFGPVSVAVSVMDVTPTTAVVLLTCVTIAGSGKTPEAFNARS